jgi:hypothetical protein
MDLFPFDRVGTTLVVLLAPVLLLPTMFLDIRLEPSRRVRPAFRPLQAVARLATLCGYVWSSRRARR